MNDSAAHLYVLSIVTKLADLLAEEKGRRQDLEAAIRAHRDRATLDEHGPLSDYELWEVLGDE